jgi:hypothetical protein
MYAYLSYNFSRSRTGRLAPMVVGHPCDGLRACSNAQGVLAVSAIAPFPLFRLWAAYPFIFRYSLDY